MKFHYYDEASMNAAWHAVEKEIKDAGEVAPAPGFTGRWRTKLAERREQERRQQVWIALSFNATLMILILTVIGMYTLPAFESTTQMIVSWFKSFSEWLVFLRMVSGIWGSMSRTLPGIVPTSWWVSLFASIIILVARWSISIRQYSSKVGDKA